MHHSLTETLAKVWRRPGGARTPVVEDVWVSVRETGGRRGTTDDRDDRRDRGRSPRLAPVRKDR